MYCGNCGTKIDKNIKFCPECGAEVKTPQFEGKSKGRRKLENFFIIVLVFVAGIAVLVCLFGENKAERVAKAYMTAVAQADGEKAVGFMPRDFVEAIVDFGWFSNQSEFADYLSGKFRENNENLAGFYGDKWKIKLKTDDVERLESYELEKIENKYFSMYGCKEDIKKGYSVEIDYTVYGNKSSFDDEKTMVINVIKTGGKWCIDVSDMDFLFY